MTLREWSQSEVDYGRKVLNSGLAGARSGRETFLRGRPLTPFLSVAVRRASMPAIIGALIGVVASRPGDHQSSARKSAAYGFFGCAVGLGMGIAWHSRAFTACVTNAAVRNMTRVRDEHWLEKHPIDYA